MKGCILIFLIGTKEAYLSIYFNISIKTIYGLLIFTYLMRVPAKLSSCFYLRNHGTG